MRQFFRAITALAALAAVLVFAPVDARAAGFTTLSPDVSGGCVLYGAQSAASTNATSVKTGPRTLCGGMVYNTTTTTYFLRLYDLATAPTASSATGFIVTIPVPPGASSGQVGGTLINFGSYGAAFSNGIAFVITGGGSSTDNTNAATGVYVVLGYQ